ncbi:TIGR01777 family oxidoreductase [uncultured Amphritea sp.]|uniref:TIGR01777 family oxidoreductase n=1 Tax=uncultured Amphritea sp. TaxID=981605 RepID=UPI0025DBEADF|nr:TIGR01777 family oxidoreductase [uncultured Amphritea sp.]
MKVLISGGTGFIGRHLIPRLLDYDHEAVVLTRSEIKARELFGSSVRVITDLNQISSDEQIDGIINLSGEGIADKRWSEKRKQALIDSRISMTADLISLIRRLEHPPEVLISGSAIGFYGCRTDDLLLNESGQVIDDYTHRLCQNWESEAHKAEAMGVRVCLIRTGVVLGNGGALAKMLPAFRFGLGGPVARGDQWMSWIHIDDEIEIICMMLTHNEFDGAYNLTAPEAVTNETFSRELAAVLSRPCWLRVPAVVLDLMLGEGSDLLVKGQNVYPERLLKAGYKFAYPDLKTALHQILEPAD